MSGNMVVWGETLALAAYHVAAVELLIVAYLAWRYNGVSTTGTGRYLGPFCLAIAALIIRLDVTLLLIMATDYDMRLAWWWPLVATVQSSIIAGWGVVLCYHMITRINRSNKAKSAQAQTDAAAILLAMTEQEAENEVETRESIDAMESIVAAEVEAEAERD